MGTRVAVLGPVAVTGNAGHTLVVGGRERRVLVALAMADGRPVPTEILVEAVWPATPPESARKAVLNAVSVLRGILGPAVIERVGTSYRLAAATDVAEVDRVVAAFRHGESVPADELARVLDLWRGEPLCDLHGWATAEVEGHRLLQLRDEVEEWWCEASIASGATAGLADAAEAMVERAPLRERRWALLMRALAATGRRAEALRVFQRARQVLGDEVGLEPGPELRAVERAIALAESTPASASTHAHFVGRGSERATLYGLWRGAVEGRPAVAVIEGDAGSGKTALVAELVRDVEADGGVAISARVIELMGRLGEIAAERPGVRGRHRASFDRVIGFDAGAVPTSAESARAVGSFLGSLARPSGAVIVVEDVHEGSADMVELVGRLGGEHRPERTLVVITVRTPRPDIPHAYEHLGARAAAKEPFAMIALDPMSESEIALLVGDDDHTIYERSGGNPMYALALRRWGRRDQLPPSLEALVRARFGELSSDARAWLALAAVAGMTFDVSVVARAAQQTPSRLGEVVDEVVGAGFVRPTRPGSFGFTHPVLHEGTEATIAVGRRSVLHARLLAAMIELGLGNTDDRARHALAAASIDPDRRRDAVELAHAAGRDAATRGAIRDATTWYETALDVHPDDDELRCDLLIGLGAALAWHADTEFREPLQRAADLAHRLGDDEREAEALLAANRVWTVNAGVPDEALLARLTRLRHRLEARSALTLASRVAAVEAAERLYSAGDHARHDAISAAQRMTTRHTDDATRVFVATRLLTVTWDNTTSERRRFELELLVPIVTARGSLIEQAMILGSLGATLVELHELDAAERHYERMSGLGAGIDLPYLNMLVRGPESVLATLRGQTDTVLERAAQITHDEPANYLTALALESEAARIQGRWQDLAAIAARHEWIFGYHHAALAAAAMGDIGPATSVLGTSSADALAAMAPSLLRCPTWFAVARVAAVAGQPKQAAAYLELLAPLAGRFEMSAQALVNGPVDLTLGLLAARAGRLRDAEHWLRSAADLASSVGNQLWHAHALAALGALLADAVIGANADTLAQRSGIVSLDLWRSSSEPHHRTTYLP